MNKVSPVKAKFIIGDSDPKSTEALIGYLKELFPKAHISPAKPSDTGGYLFFADFGFEWEVEV
jgi:hypothetical protein